MKLYFDELELQNLARSRREEYLSAEPFPHVVIDNLLPAEALEEVLREFPAPGHPVWKEYQTYHEQKLETQGEGRLGVEILFLLYQFNSAPFLRFLETLTGVENLLPDPYFFGAGLHQIKPGGKLSVHADFTQHVHLPLERRLNVLVYLNKDWKEEYGGQLELWDETMSRCVKKILPVFNRTVVLQITDWSFHGHPDPLNSPEGVTRKSIALYYYTIGRPEGELLEGKQTTLFMPRPGENVPAETVRAGHTYTGAAGVKPAAHRPPTRKRRIFRRFIPPILLDAARCLKDCGKSKHT